MIYTVKVSTKLLVELLTVGKEIPASKIVQGLPADRDYTIRNAYVFGKPGSLKCVEAENGIQVDFDDGEDLQVKFEEVNNGNRNSD